MYLLSITVLCCGRIYDMVIISCESESRSWFLTWTLHDVKNFFVNGLVSFHNFNSGRWITFNIKFIIFQRARTKINI